MLGGICELASNQPANGTGDDQETRIGRSRRSAILMALVGLS